MSSIISIVIVISIMLGLFTYGAYLFYQLNELEEMRIENYRCMLDDGIYYFETRECYKILDTLDEQGFHMMEKLW